MVFSAIVTGITLLMVAFALVWWLNPGVRAWMEAPKYRVLEWDRSHPDAERQEP